MDAACFDRLARSLTTIGSRRRALTAVVSGALGVLSLAGPDDIEAKKKKPCPSCRKRKKAKCKGKLPDGTPCGNGICSAGTCAA